MNVVSGVLAKIEGEVSVQHAPYIYVVGVTMVVYEMLRWHAPPVLILLALLVQWNTQIPHTKEPKLSL